MDVACGGFEVVDLHVGSQWFPASISFSSLDACYKSIGSESTEI